MTVTKDDFNKIWASTSPLKPYSFSKSHYKEGWNFIGSTPPSRQMWDFLQKQNDEKMQYLANNYLPLSGGTMTGELVIGSGTGQGHLKNSGDYFRISATKFLYADNPGAGLVLRGRTTTTDAGVFLLEAQSDSGSKTLVGKPDGTLTWDGQPLLPVGVVQAFAGTTIPSGWLLCDGSAVSRTTYASLYACIGTTYGAGNGSTTFNLPNLIDKFVEGSATAGTVKSAGLPNITGGMFINGGRSSTDNGAIKYTATAGGGGTDNSNTGTGSVNFDASRSNSIYGKSTTVQPPALTMRYIIKY